MPFFQKGKLMPCPNSALKEKKISVDLIQSPVVFLPFGQRRHIVSTQPLKKKLDVKAIQAQHLRASGPDLLLVYKTDIKQVSTARANELILSRYNEITKSRPTVFEKEKPTQKAENRRKSAKTTTSSTKIEYFTPRIQSNR